MQAFGIQNLGCLMSSTKVPDKINLELVHNHHSERPGATYFEAI